MKFGFLFSVPGRSVALGPLERQDIHPILSVVVPGHAFIGVVVVATAVTLLSSSTPTACTVIGRQAVLSFVAARSAGNIVVTDGSAVLALVIAAIRWLLLVIGSRIAVCVQLSAQSAVKRSTEGCVDVVAAAARDPVTVRF